MTRFAVSESCLDSELSRAMDLFVRNKLVRIISCRWLVTSAGNLVEERFENRKAHSIDSTLDVCPYLLEIAIVLLNDVEGIHREPKVLLYGNLQMKVAELSPLFDQTGTWSANSFLNICNLRFNWKRLRSRLSVGA